MKRMATRVFTGVLAGNLAILFLVLPLKGQPSAATATPSSGAHDPGVRAGAAAAGNPLPGLTSGQLGYFTEGQNSFLKTDFVRNPPPGGDAGLGPGFNSDSCFSCHRSPAVGGSSPSVNPQVAVATKMGANNQVPPFITQNGPVREVRFRYNSDGSRDGGVHDLFTIAGRSDAAGCNASQQDFSNTSNLSFRIPTPTFGLGLVEGIPDITLINNLAANPTVKTLLGISGRFNTSGNDGTITRFGWKAQNKSLQIFAGEAYNVEQGITNALFPQERNQASGCMFNGTPEDSINFDTGTPDDVALFAAFMRFLAPPDRGPVSPSVAAGALTFVTTGCAVCHTPVLQTGSNSVAALNEKPVPLFSDLALHSMGPGLADDILQGAAQGDEFRTAPLWGLGQRIFFLHDGRTSDLVQAINAHASPGNPKFGPSEANAVIHRFGQLSNSGPAEPAELFALVIRENSVGSPTTKTPLPCASRGEQLVGTDDRKSIRLAPPRPPNAGVVRGLGARPSRRRSGAPFSAPPGIHNRRAQLPPGLRRR